MANDFSRIKRKLWEVPLYLFGLFNPSNSLVIMKNAISLSRGRFWDDYLPINDQHLDDRIKETLGWINRAQEVTDSDGISCYEFKGGWTKGFPEVTGYIIPTYWRVYEAFGQKEIYNKAIEMSEWLLTCQFSSGGIKRSYEAEDKPPIIFDTGQALRGFLASYRYTGDERYLKARFYPTPSPARKDLTVISCILSSKTG